MDIAISGSNNKLNSFTVRELLYYAYFAVMLTTKGFGFYVGQKVYTLSLIIGAILIIAKILCTKHSLYEWAVIVLLCALGVAIYFHSDEVGAMIIIATVIGMKDVSLKKVMALGACIWAFTYFSMMFITLVGLKRDIFKVQNKFGLGFIVRWSLGQPHPNVLQISFILFCAFLLYLLGFKGKKLYITSAIMLLGNFYVFMYSLSVTGIALAVVYLVMNIYLTELRDKIWKKEDFHIAEKILFIAAVPVFATFSILAPNLLTGKVWDFFNKLFNTRFNIAREYMRLNPITLFGTGYCNELPTDLNNLDCSYVFALMHYGIIFFALMVTGYTILVIYQIKKNMRIELAITIALALTAVSEPFFVNTSFKNISWLFIGELLFTGLKWLEEKYKLPEIQVLKIGDETKNLPVDKVVGLGKSLLATYRRFPKIIFGIAAMLGIFAGCLYGTFKEMPHAYYLNRNNVQVIDKGFYLDKDNLPEDFDGVFLEYTSPETVMFRIDGSAVKAEYVRGVVSFMVWGFLIVSIGLGISINRIAKTEIGEGSNGTDSNNSGS
ncbi:MAG: hypothetical protein K6A38_06890 [Lachnospiraceae bacterium]|nr:hypothetical protein [Lachnospiraceae bacterium]